MTHSLIQAPRYANFIKDRDLALERIHRNTQIDLSRMLYEVLERTEHLAASLALKSTNAFLPHQLSHSFEDALRDIFAHSFSAFVRRIVKQRLAVFVLTYASEQEAIGRATQRKSHDLVRAAFKNKLSKALTRETIDGPLDKRVWLALMKLRLRIAQAFGLALTQELKPQEIVAKVKDAFPRIQVYKRPPRALTRLKEAAGDLPEDKKDWVDLQFIDDPDWDLMMDAYKETELPPSRFDAAASWDKESGMMRYEWELEQEATEDFVKQVRDGQVDAANDLGIQEFVWIAVIDNKTCDDCCLPRNGKTTSEIEEGIDSGSMGDCDATVPPAHFNCRCQVGPVASVDEVQGPDWSSFNEWLGAA